MIVATQPPSDSAQPTAVTLLAGGEPILQASPKVDMVLTPLSVFFFSSRRRHTSLTCDWSSDVYSSDLRKSEALQDRIIMIKVPYNLKVTQEERIYDKLLKQSDALRNIHIAPNALKIAAMFAVMTRLEEPKKANIDIVKKMKLYDGEDVEGFKSKDVRELQE